MRQHVRTLCEKGRVEMIDLGEAYLWVKALHVIAVIAWMAGLLYFPRLCVYHTEVAPGSEASEKFKVMERRLMKAIMTPAGIVATILGLLLLANWGDWSEIWVHVKLTMVVLLWVSHFMMIGWLKAFAEDRNAKSQKYFRMMNEVPTLLMIVIVLAVVVKF